MGGNLKEKNKQIMLKLTSGGTIGAFTAVAESSPFRAPTTASAISIATPSYENKILKTQHFKGQDRV